MRTYYKLTIQKNYNSVVELYFDTRKEAINYLTTHYKEYEKAFGIFTSQITEY